MNNIVEMDPGYAGKSEILRKRIVDVIKCGEFDDMKISEIIGVLFMLASDFARQL
jgi:hypothetical protein